MVHEHIPRIWCFMLFLLRTLAMIQAVKQPEYRSMQFHPLGVAHESYVVSTWYCRVERVVYLSHAFIMCRVINLSIVLSFSLIP